MRILTLSPKSIPSAIPSMKNTAEMASFIVLGLCVLPFLPHLSPHPKMKNVAILVAFLVFNSSPILCLKNAAEMASFSCLTSPSPSPSSRHEKYGQLGRIFYAWVPVQSPSHSEHEKSGRNGLVSRAWPLLPSFAFPPTQTKMWPNRLHFLCCSYLVPLPHQSYV